MIDELVLFGATGDLAGRYLLPALAALEESRRLPARFELLGTAERDLDDEGFRRWAAAELDEHAPGVAPVARESLVRSLRYRRADLADTGSVADLLGAAGGARPVAAYLALPAGLFPVAVRALAAVGLPPGSRVAVEKPFGEDLAGARELNHLLDTVCGEAGGQAAFRVDHFLGMATVQNLVGLRLANRVVEAVWRSEHIEQVEVIWEETLALEGRASYYDRAGQLRDMLQNHLLQVLCLVAMEPPAAPGAADLRDRKLDVLRSVRPMRPADAAARSRRARYTAGRIGERAVPAYVEEAGVDPGRGTETFAEVELSLDNERWAGTRFVLRSGKALGRDRMEVVARFRRPGPVPHGDDLAGPDADELRVGLAEPGAVTLALWSWAGAPPQLAPVALVGRAPGSAEPAYSRVLLELLDGGSTLSVRGDAAEEAWRVVTPVLEAWADGLVPLEEYPAGSAGPRAACPNGSC